MLLSLVWSCGPIFVSVLAFYAYVAQGHELTIGIAFTVSTSFCFTMMD